MFRIWVATIAAAGLLAGAGGAVAQVSGKSDEVSAVEVSASLEVKVSVAVGGDIGPRTFVSSAPLGIDCGGSAYRFTSEELRQCWLWVRRKRETLLTAQAEGRFGTDWTVQWTGCEPIANGAACRLTPKIETNVAAVFVRMTPLP